MVIQVIQVSVILEHVTCLESMLYVALKCSSVSVSSKDRQALSLSVAS